MYNLLRFIVTVVLRLFFRLTVTGADHLPPQGPVIVASNHVSLWDPPVIGCSISREIHFMAKEELFAIPFLRQVILVLKAFPVRRGMADRNAIRTAIRLLAEGRVVGLFPEGTRSKTGDLGRAEPGLAMIAARSGAIVVPTALVGTNCVFCRGSFLPRFRVAFGPPMPPPPEKASREELDDFSARIMAEITRLRGGKNLV